MFGANLNKSECPIGIDLGAHGVRLLQLAKRGGQMVAVAAAFEPLPAKVRPADGQAYQDAVTQAIAKCLSSAGFTTRRVVSALPASAVHSKNLRLPKMPADELRAAVAWEAADRLRMPAEKNFVAISQRRRNPPGRRDPSRSGLARSEARVCGSARRNPHP